LPAAKGIYFPHRNLSFVIGAHLALLSCAPLSLLNPSEEKDLFFLATAIREKSGLDHRTVDGKANIITDTHVTPANIHDSLPYLERLDYQKSKFGFSVKSVGLDAGYYTPAICKGINDRKIFGVISYRKPNHKKGYFYKRQFQYLANEDVYLCPGGQKLPYNTTTRNGYRHYHSNPEVCQNCPLLGKCTRSKGKKENCHKACLGGS
jgi:hypothetical protein